MPPFTLYSTVPYNCGHMLNTSSSQQIYLQNHGLNNSLYVTTVRGWWVWLEELFGRKEFEGRLFQVSESRRSSSEILRSYYKCLLWLQDKHTLSDACGMLMLRFGFVVYVVRLFIGHTQNNLREYIEQRKESCEILEANWKLISLYWLMSILRKKWSWTLFEQFFSASHSEEHKYFDALQCAREKCQHIAN